MGDSTPRQSGRSRGCPMRVVLRACLVLVALLGAGSCRGVPGVRLRAVADAERGRRPRVQVCAPGVARAGRSPTLPTVARLSARHQFLQPGLLPRRWPDWLSGGCRAPGVVPDRPGGHGRLPWRQPLSWVGSFDVATVLPRAFSGRSQVWAAAPMIGAALMVRPDTMAELLGVLGFFLALGPSSVRVLPVSSSWSRRSSPSRPRPSS